MTTKAGPNGHALHHAIEDLINLPDCLLKDLITLGGDTFASKIQNLKDCLKHKMIPGLFPQSEGKLIRKLNYFPDREDKVRVVAIFDYFSQTVLKTLHTYLYRVLSKIPQDCTFDQGSFKDKMKDCDIYYSVDITAFTDRLPIQVISSVLKGKLPFHYVDS